MADFKVNIGDPKTGKTVKKDIVGDDAKLLLNKKIGDKVKGDKIGFSGYEFEITGGSDSSGFPMRRDVNGTARKRILISSGIGTRHNRKGMRLRRTVVGNTINSKTAQINMKILKHGSKALDEAPAEKAKEEPVEEAKPDKTSKEEVKEETPKEAKKEKKEEAKEKKPPKKVGEKGVKKDRPSKEKKASKEKNTKTKGKKEEKKETKKKT